MWDQGKMEPMEYAVLMRRGNALRIAGNTTMVPSVRWANIHAYHKIMPTKRAVKSYMKPVARRVTIQKPVQKQAPAAGSTASDGFTRISDSKIRKVYK